MEVRRGFTRSPTIHILTLEHGSDSITAIQIAKREENESLSSEEDPYKQYPVVRPERPAGAGGRNTLKDRLLNSKPIQLVTDYYKAGKPATAEETSQLFDDVRALRMEKQDGQFPQEPPKATSFTSRVTSSAQKWYDRKLSNRIVNKANTRVAKNTENLIGDLQSAQGTPESEVTGTSSQSVTDATRAKAEAIQDDTTATNLRLRKIVLEWQKRTGNDNDPLYEVIGGRRVTAPTPSTAGLASRLGGTGNVEGVST